MTVSVQAAWKLSALERNGFPVAVVSDRIEFVLRTMGPLFVKWESVPVTGEELLHVLAARESVPPEQWSPAIQSVLCTLWCLDYSGCRLEEMNGQDLDDTCVSSFFWDKLQLYTSHLGITTADPLHQLPLRTRLDLIRDLRPLVDEQYIRFATVEGTTWCRTEELLARNSLQPDALPPSLLAELERRWGVRYAPPATAFWSDLCRTVMETEGSPLELIRMICQSALTDPALSDSADAGPDYVILVAPKRMDWQQPWVMDASWFWCLVEIRPGFEPGAEGLQTEGRMIQRMIRARVLHNKHKAALYYHPDRNQRHQGFRLLEMTDRSTNESAHHRGHQSAGITTAIRSPFPLTHPEQGITVKGFADFRINRAGADALPWSNQAVKRCMEYGIWCRAILETALAKGYEFPDLKY